MKAKYAGTCLVCRRPIRKGDDIVYERNAGAAHEACDKVGAIRDGDDEDIGALPAERRRGRPERRDW